MKSIGALVIIKWRYEFKIKDSLQVTYMRVYNKGVAVKIKIKDSL